jgi:tetratricopeptide (TPR) repeat protein
LQHRAFRGFDNFCAAQFEMSAKQSLAFFLPALLAAYAGVWQIQKKIDAQRAAIYVERDELMLRSGSSVKAMSLEYAPLMADIYWTRAVQYFGNKQLAHDTNLELLWPLLDVTTTLDPELLPAYRFGSTFLGEPSPRGAGHPELAVKLLERGIQANPRDVWRLYQDLAYVYYFNLKDYNKASEAFLNGSKMPGAQAFMKMMAAKIAGEGESFETSVFLWREVYDSSTDKDIRRNAAVHLKMLAARLDCRRLDELSAQFAKRMNRRPANMSQLVQAGFLARIPADSLGYPYLMDPSGNAIINPKSPLADEKTLLRAAP